MRRLPAILLALALSGGGLVAVPTSAGAANGRTPLPGSTPSWATPANRVGAAKKDGKVVFRTYLQLRDQAGAEAMARAVSDPASAAYGKYLSAAQVRQSFAPSAASVQALSRWLGQAGFSVGYVPANNQFVEATGSVSQVEQAFGATLSIYSVKGQKVRGSDHDLTVPASLAGTVAGVVGIDQALSLMRPDNAGADRTPDGASAAAAAPAASAAASAQPGVAPPPDGFRNVPPCSAYWAQRTTGTTLPRFDGYPQDLPYAPCGYTPQQMRQVYGMQPAVDRGVDGSGTTVAVIDAFASPTLLADAQQYANNHDPGHPLLASQFSERIFPENPSLEVDCDASGWYGEQSLDVEAVHAMAPGAHIVYVGGSDCNDISLDKALNEVVSRQMAQIVTNSYGGQGEDLPPSLIRLFQRIAIQAVLQGIGVYFSSGDSGDEAANLGTPSPDFPATSPWVTAVGGTSLGIGQDGQRVLETGWETTKSTLVNGVWTPPPPGAFLYGSGGGTSRIFPEPFYQLGVVPDALARKNQVGNQRGRVVPDLSVDGDPSTGFLIGLTQTFPGGAHYSEYRIGGTSLSSPLLAGIMALSDDLTGFQHGFINPVLYAVGAHSPAITDVRYVMAAVARVNFVNGLNAHDGTSTSIRTFDFEGLAIHTAPGYDDVTGLGTPNGLFFLLTV